MEFLQEQKKTMGLRAFNAEYQNMPSDEDTELFTEAMIKDGTMGKDISAGVTFHNFIENKWLLNLYGSWGYRFWGYQSWKHTGSVGIGFGGIKSLVNLKKPVYWDKAKKKYFKSLGIGATFDIEQKFSKDAYIGGRYGATLWGQLNRNMIGLSLGIDHTRNIGPGMYGKVHYSYLFGK